MNKKLLSLTAQIVTAHAEYNEIPGEALSGMIQSVYRALSTVDEPELAPADAQSPAVPVKKSVFPEFIVCLEDGQRLKMLKRHLKTSYGLTPDAYRAKWKLPSDYPMVAPSYASKRSALAKSIGLGRKPSVVNGGGSELGSQDEPLVTIMPARRARGSKG